jgi:GNAT superfamily N-acetyltransferase
VDSVWVQEEHRRQGVGAKLMKTAEDEARRRGCHHAHLETAEGQAPDFYRKLGYEVFGALEQFGPTKLFFLQKAL